jgi:hypothetical protein
MFLIRCVSLVCQSFLHLWRYISYLIGVRDEFNPLTSLNRARGAVQSVVSHLLDPDGTSMVLAAHMIRSISYRAPYLCYLSRIVSIPSRLLLQHHGNVEDRIFRLILYSMERFVPTVA